MKKISSNSDVTLYDAAPSPAILLLVLGIPLAIMIMVGIIIIVTILLVRKARRKNQTIDMMDGQSGTISPETDPTASNPSENSPQNK